MSNQSNRKSQLFTLAAIALLGAMGYLLSFMEFPTFASFLKYDAGDVPALIAALLFGPAAGVWAEVVKGILMLSKDTFIGITANVLAGGVLLVVITLIWRRGKNIWWSVGAVVAGTLAMTIVMAAGNYYVFFPIWGIPRGQSLPIIISAVTPFNLLKGGLNGALGLLLYRRLGDAIAPYVDLDEPAVVTDKAS